MAQGRGKNAGPMDNEEAHYPGASAEAIRAHYDVGNDFYRLWLDETMTYSAAMWRDERDTSSLADAQRRKIAWHLHHSEANRVDPFSTSAVDGVVFFAPHRQ